MQDQNDIKQKNEDVLQMVYQNSKMGVDSITHIIPKVKSERLKSDLTAQMTKYQDFVKASTKGLNEICQKPKELGVTKTVPAAVGIEMNTMFNSSESHIAELMINGSTMGIVELKKKINEYKNDNLPKATTKMASDAIVFEEQNIDRLKTYL